MDFNPDGRIVWVEIEGVPFKFWTGNTFKRIASKWGVLLDVDDQDESCFHSKRLCLYTKYHMNIFECFKLLFHGKVFWIRAKEVPGWVPELLDDLEDEEQSDDDLMKGDNKVQDMGSCGDVDEVPETTFGEPTGPKEKLSEDPFDIYALLNKKRNVNYEHVNKEDQSLQFPPGFTPKPTVENDDKNADGDKPQECNSDSVNGGSKGDVSDSVCTGRFKKSEAPRTGGLFLCFMEEVVKVGQTIGYNMEGCMTNLSEIIKSQGETMVHR
ncbi:RNA-directed DNA polymerase, eukaryota, reverse transcriptase zinc-binding domain protein [Tanacetum coccineum]